MIYPIFRNNIVIATVKPDDNSELSQKKQSEDLIRLNFTLETYIDFNIGDYISYTKTQQLYYINKKPRVSEESRNFKYECIFEGSSHQLRKTKIFLETPKTTEGSYRDYKFPLVGNALTFLEFVVDNLNRNSSGYMVGACIDSDVKTVEFNNWNCFEAITEASAVFGFDWYLNGKEINFASKVVNIPYVFQVGRKVGLIGLSRMRVESENIETVVYGYGSTINLPPRISDTGITYDSELLTDNRLCFSGVNGESKLEKNVDLYGRIESVQEFEDIKPERIGTITALETDDFNSFYDINIDFDINVQLLPNIPVKLNFLTGKLMGFEFTLTYDNAIKKFTLIPYSDETGTYPNELIKPEIDDQYVLIDLQMPESYIVDAQTRLQAAVQSYLDSKSTGLEYYEAELDEEFIEAFGISLDLGDLVRIVSTAFTIDHVYEIKELTQNVVKPNVYTIRFGDVIPKSILSLVKLLAFNTNQQFYNIQRTTYNSTEITNIVGAEALAWVNL